MTVTVIGPDPDPEAHDYLTLMAVFFIIAVIAIAAFVFRDVGSFKGKSSKRVKDGSKKKNVGIRRSGRR